MTPNFVQLAVRERLFLGLLLAGFAVVALTFRVPVWGAWTGFVLAGYSAVANDSIQTIGTFIASNRDQRWWWLWLFMGTIFVLTVGWSWWVYGGDVSHQRLAAKGFDIAPNEFSYLQVAAPLFLMMMTRLRMPVSTTFLLLSSFATTGESVGQVLHKSVTGYGLAFTLSIVLWLALGPIMNRAFRGASHPAWRAAQWITSGLLWSVWIMQDAANIAVYLPRSLSAFEFLCFSGVIFGGLGLLFFWGGERVQRVVDEKSHVMDVRPTTVINVVYASILYYFKIQSKIPMSTTWVFIGLLGGRELAMAIRGVSSQTPRGALRLLLKDLFYVGAGLLLSLLVAMAVNEVIREEVAAFGISSL